MSFDFIDSTPVYGVPNQQQMQMYQNPMVPNPQFASQQQQVVVNQPQPQMYQPNFANYNYDTPEIVIDNPKDSGAKLPDLRNIGKIKVDDPIVEESKPKRRKRETGSSTEIIRADNASLANGAVSGTIEDIPTAYTYAETTGMLRETLGQIDALSSELAQEFNNVRASRTMKNKYGALANISENMSSLISSKIAAIREINSSISKSNDLDYKKIKDQRAAQGQVDDDKYIAELYKAFISNPQAQISQPSMPTPQIPMINEGSAMNSGIIRANVDNSGNLMGGDQAYLNYMSNLTPEQNLMFYEQNPNVKQVVVFDHATGNKFFQYMDMSTGQVVPNLPVYDQDFMADTTLDLAKGVAKNLNLNETFPIVQINQDSVKNEY